MNIRQKDLFLGLDEKVRQSLFAHAKKRRIVFPEFEDHRILAAQKILESEFSIEVIDFGCSLMRSEKDRVREFLLERALKKKKPDCLKTDAMRNAELEELARDSLFVAGYLLAQNRCDAVVAGACHSTARVVRAILSTTGLQQEVSTLTSAFLMSLKSPTAGGQRLLVFTDAGVVPSPTAAQLVDIAHLGRKAFERWTQVEAQVAFLSFSTNGSASHADSLKMKDATLRFQTQYPEVAAVGEIQFDAAVVPEVFQAKMCSSAGEKNLQSSQDTSQSRIRPGACNVMVFPDLDAGNICYKAVQRLAGADAWGPIILGASLPFSDLSRGCSVEDIVCVSLLTLALG